jgi:hypothetical protein
MNIVLDLSFHNSFCIDVFYKLEFFQMCVFVHFCLLNPIFLLLWLLVVKFIFVRFFFSCTIVVIIMKEVQLVVVMDDLNFGIRDVMFEVKLFTKYGTFNFIKLQI